MSPAARSDFETYRNTAETRESTGTEDGQTELVTRAAAIREWSALDFTDVLRNMASVVRSNIVGPAVTSCHGEHT